MVSPTKTVPLAHSVDEACAALSIGRSRLYELIASGELPSIKLGRRRLISHASLEAFIATLERDTTRAS